jgi:preprotein translocase subunit YajC
MDPTTLYSIAPLIFIFAIMYFLMIRPQQQRMKQHREMVENVKRGDTVVTAGGVVGKVQVRVVKSTLSEVRARTQPVDTSKSSDKS